MQATATTTAADRCAISRAVQLRREDGASGCGRHGSPGCSRGQKSARPNTASAAGTSVTATATAAATATASPGPSSWNARTRATSSAISPAVRIAPPASTIGVVSAVARVAASSRVAPPQRLRTRVREVEDDVVGDDAEHERDEQRAQQRRLREAGPAGHVRDELLGQGVGGADGRKREERRAGRAEAHAHEQRDQDDRRDLDQRQRAVDQRPLVHLRRGDAGDAHQVVVMAGDVGPVASHGRLRCVRRGIRGRLEIGDRRRAGLARAGHDPGAVHDGERDHARRRAPAQRRPIGPGGAGVHAGRDGG